MSRRKPKLFEAMARAKSSVLATSRAPRRRAVVRAERAVVDAAEKWTRTRNAYTQAAALDELQCAVLALREARKAGRR